MPDQGLLCDLLWSDPDKDVSGEHARIGAAASLRSIPSPHWFTLVERAGDAVAPCPEHTPPAPFIGWGDNDRGVSYTFGADIVRKFLDEHDLDLVCRAHQARPWDTSPPCPSHPARPIPSLGIPIQGALERPTPPRSYSTTTRASHSVNPPPNPAHVGDDPAPTNPRAAPPHPATLLSLLQVVEDGYEFFAQRQLVTVFSAPNYCGEFDNAGAMMSVDDTLMCSFQVQWDGVLSSEVAVWSGQCGLGCVVWAVRLQ